MTTVTIKKGVWRNVELNNDTFTLVKAYNPKKGYVVVMADQKVIEYAGGTVRIKVDSENDLIYHDLSAANVPRDIPAKDSIQEYKDNETDEMAMERIKKSFDHLDLFSDAIAKGVLKGLIVVGPAGVGKSFGVISILNEYSAAIKQWNNTEEDIYKRITGAISAPYLYQMLYRYKDKGKILVLDDTEIDDTDTINMLKAALDTCGPRVIDWAKESAWLAREDMPNSFTFEGGIIYLSNEDIADRKGKMGIHLNAVVSRCHYINLNINDMKDKLLRIRQVIDAGMLHGRLTPVQEQALIKYVYDNADHFRELSLRTCIKLSDLMSTFPDNWEDMAESSLMKPAAAFARLVEKNQLCDVVDE